MRVLPALCNPSLVLPLAAVEPALLGASPMDFCTLGESLRSVDCTQPIKLKIFSSSREIIPMLETDCPLPSVDRVIGAFHAASDGFLRRNLVVQAGQCPEPAARDFLLEMLSDRTQTFGLRLAAAEGLASRDDVSAEPLSAAYRSMSYPVKPSPLSREPQNVLFFRQSILGAMGAIRNGSARDFLLEVAGDENEKREARFSALDALGETGDLEAVSALVGIARGTSAIGFRARAIEALGKIGGPEALRTLNTLWKDTRQPETIRKKAVSALGAAGRKAPGSGGVVDGLVNALKSGSNTLRAASAKALATTAGFGAVEAAMCALGTEKDPAIRESLLNVLLNNPEPRMAPVFEQAARTHRNAKIRAHALQLYCSYAGDAALGTLKDVALRETVTGVLQEAFVGLQAIGGLRILPSLFAIRSLLPLKGLDAAIDRFDGPEAVTEVLETFHEKWDRFPFQQIPYQKHMIAFLIKRKSDKRVPAFLTGLLESGRVYSSVAEEAIEGLSDASDLRSFRVLRAIVERESGSYRQKAYQVFEKRCRTRNELLALLAEGGASERMFVLEKLASYGDAESVGFLYDYLKGDPDPSVRGEVIRLYDRKKLPGATDALMEAYRSDPDANVRAYAMARLLDRNRSNPQIRQMILDALGDESPIVRVSAVSSLNHLRPKGDVSLLARSLRNDPEPMVRVEAARALCWRRPLKVDLFITVLTSDADPKVRYASLGGLSRNPPRRALAALAKAAKGDADEPVRSRAAEILRFMNGEADEDGPEGYEF